ncbi:hypothetical protein JTE90_004288 [Oedothorax gibbosus]|uniref:G-protein coupled receptors family 1 profile domain-containing protein n=1 Tax=Oedothorax gibbosus TaxID=931172 RepID=A0AAV6VLI5_9ARAC|nr:hypothetical protein JTE90_004288 [Oedothorax gibbosus]
MTAIGTLSAIAIDRYIIISRSFAGQMLTGVSPSCTILCIWVYALAQALPPLLGWNRYIVEHPGIACSLDWQTSDLYHSSFITYIFILGYVLPVLTMAFCYGRVVIMIRGSSNPNVRSSTAKAERKVTVMACVMLFCTLVAWTPYAAVSLMVALGYGAMLGPISAVSPAIFAKTSVVYNPIVYFFFNTQIRECILAKMPRCRKRRHDGSCGDISLETKRGLTIINTVVSNQLIGDNGCATTLNL